MKIALLNLPFDNNYGGNLQRYALMKVLKNMGHDVTHINLRYSYSVSNFKILLRIAKRIFLKLIGKRVDFFYESHMRKERQQKEKYANEFYDKYIKHTEILNNITAVKRYRWSNFDIAMVGSDQVWRYDMAKYSIGLKNFFFKFLDDKIIKIAYSVSLGKYGDSEIDIYRALVTDYSKFSAVSFREQQGVDFAYKVGWNNPIPQQTLDPTLLLPPEIYTKELNLKKQISNSVFCYMLDKDEDKQKQIEIILSNEFTNCKIVECGLNVENCIPVEQWLENIMNTQCVITDSYHGVVFSILFNKNFYFLGNPRRGNDRLISLLNTFSLDFNDFKNMSDWTSVNKQLEYLRVQSLYFLDSAINSSIKNC